MRETVTKKYKFVVEIRLKQGNKLTHGEALRYVRDAVRFHKGCYNPDSNEYELDANQIFVRSFIE